MAFNSLITRDDAASLIPEPVANQIIDGVRQSSMVFQLGRRLPNMTSKSVRMPVASALAEAYFVNGDTGFKQTTKAAWANKYIHAEELAVVVPIPENVLADSEYPIWSQVQPQIVEALYKAVDAAILFGTNAPATWPADIVTGATAAGNTVQLGGSLYDAVMGESGIISKVELDGYLVNGHAAALQMRGKIRGMKSNDGVPLFAPMTGGSVGIPYAFDGTPIAFNMNGAWDLTKALMVSGDWNQLVYSIRSDISFKMFTEGVITDSATPPNIIYNLMQQDMVALRVTMRLGWQLPNPITRMNPTEADRYPFAALLPAP